jgi:hypothetical protein
VLRSEQKKKTLEIEVQERLSKGLKPHVVEVTTRGRIEGACEGHNTWDDLMKSKTPHYLDVYVVLVR